MNRKILPSEALKLLACATMLLDHIGATVYPSMTLRIIGRISFPIFCFLLAEGAVHTRDPKRYLLRLAIGMLLAELPFDYLFYGGFTWSHQSVMVTLFLGCLALVTMEQCHSSLYRFLWAIPFIIIADFLNTDYGGYGVLLIAIFGWTRTARNGLLLQTLGLGLIFSMLDSAVIQLWGLQVSVQMFGVAAMVPIALYSGRKVTNSPIAQLGFYLFYPVHLAVLWLVYRYF